MHTDDPEQPITLNLPPLSDELAVVLHDFLQDVIGQYESRYLHQMRRYHQACDRQRRERQAQMLFQYSQRSLPLNDSDTF